jgi:hypothetical protein
MFNSFRLESTVNGSKYRNKVKHHRMKDVANMLYCKSLSPSDVEVENVEVWVDKDIK